MSKVKMFFVLILAVALFASSSNVPKESVQLKLSIFDHIKTSDLLFTHNRGVYQIKGDGQLIATVQNGERIRCTQFGHQINVKVQDKHLGSFKEVEFNGTDYANNLKLKSIKPASQIRIYEDLIRLYVKGNRIAIINEPELNHYVAGVVESEVGKNAHIEYYKLQSILCRTYALSNLRRHEEEGFNLCDQVHCQVYNGKSVANRDILKATAATTGLVVIDKKLDLITATFHSNCGGETVNSEDVWSLPMGYLRGVRDTFCHTEHHAVWTKIIAKKDWKHYLSKKFKVAIHDESNENWMYHYEQKNRDVFFSPYDIPLKTIRHDWKLNSTYFSISEKSDSLVFQGKGFGHGVGLCQEGAMKMATLGHSYKSILNHYYLNVNLVNLSALRFVIED